MDRSQILNRVKKVFQFELDEPDLQLEETATIADIEVWDSLSHVIICKALETEFNISITAREMLACEDIRSLIDVIDSKL